MPAARFTRAVAAGLAVAAIIVRECAGAPPKGCECIGKSRAQALIKKNTKGKTVEQLGEDFGSYCAAWEDGACSSTSCLNATGGPGHKCGTLKECTALWPSDSNGVVNYDQSQPWCCDAWCYVDKTTCTDAIQQKYDLDVEKSWLGVEGLYYSYSACEDDQSFPKAFPAAGYNKDNSAVTVKSYASYTAKTCPYTVEPHGCECLGDNSILGQQLKNDHGAHYGKWCAAWEDGKQTAGTEESVRIKKNGAHTSSKTCSQHWPNGLNASWPANQRTASNNWYNFSLPQPWCCWSWCYVDRLKCTDEVAKKHGIVPPKRSWTGKNIWYSYGACADWGSRPTLPKKEANGQAADLSQYTCQNCPYVSGKPGNAEICANADTNKPVLGAAPAKLCFSSAAAVMPHSMLLMAANAAVAVASSRVLV